MELEISRQALSLLCFFGLGLTLGLVYDLLRPIRYLSRLALAADILFCAAGAGACFYLAMASGRAGVWEIMAAGLGFCLYINLASPVILPIVLEISGLISRLFYSLGKKYKKFALIVKKFFTNEQK